MIELLESIRYTIIMIYVDRLTKIKHFILTINKIIIKEIINLFVNNVYKLHGFPAIIISDYGS